jgi:streptomycin 6-kinase
MFDEYLARWGLTPDGDLIVTRSARLLPVRRITDGVPAMLKIAVEAEERFGGQLMVWWNGDGAAPVLAHDPDALLLLRAEGTRSLVEMARSGPGGDDEATRILCRAVARLHAPRPHPAPELVPLTRWFQDLFPAAARHGGAYGILTTCAATARELLHSPSDPAVLHGDIHHANVLHFGSRGWLAIDPKRLSGDRAFDYANLFCNPDDETAADPGRFARRVAIVAEESGLERGHLLRWIRAWCGLSAAWTLADGGAPETCLRTAERASAALTAHSRLRSGP